MVKWLTFLTVVLAVGGYRGAAGQTASSADPEEIADVLNELAEAGAPATEAEISEFLTDSASPHTRGMFLGRTGWTADEGLDHTVRLRLSRAWFEMRGRWRRYRDGSVEYAGAAIFGPARWRLAAGRLALSHGFGLLAAGAGRGPSLAADARLGTAGRGLVLWAGSAAPQTLLGLGMAVGTGAWRSRVVVGRQDSSAPDQATVLAQVSGRGRRWQAEVLCLSDPRERGLSVAGLFGRGGLEAAWEGSWRRPFGAEIPLTALLGQIGWRPHHTVRLEVIAGWADHGPRPILGQKHPVFGDWGGQGVAVRGTWRAAGGLGLKLLVHRGRGLEDVFVRRRSVRTLTDAQLGRTWPGGWVAETRWREGAEDIAAWSERFPWQPPATARRDWRRVVSVKVGRRRPNGRVQLLWRRLSLARVSQTVGRESGGARSLLALTAAAPVGAALRLRAAWTMSWGDPVDLVSAVVPFTGYVLPRHWGHWRSEHLLGLEWRHRAWQCRGAISWRQSDPDRGPEFGTGALAAWLEAAWNW